MNNCPLCSSNKVRKISVLTGSRTGEKHPLYACHSCFTLFQKSTYHEDEKALKRDLQWHINWKEQYNDLHTKKIIEKLLEFDPTAKTMLDIGCGIGSSLLAGNKLGLICSGVEPNPFACKYAKQHYNFDFVEDYFHPEHFPNNFDIVILDQVLEHVPNPQQFIKDVFSVVKPSGLLYLGVPGNRGGIVRVLFSLLFQQHRMSIFNDNDVHINHFFHRGILHLCHSNNAKVVYKMRPGDYIIQKSAID